MSSTVMKHQTSVRANGRQTGCIAGWTIPTNNRAKKRRFSKLTRQHDWYVARINQATSRDELLKLWFMASGLGHIDLLGLGGLFDERMTLLFNR